MILPFDNTTDKYLVFVLLANLVGIMALLALLCTPEIISFSAEISSRESEELMQNSVYLSSHYSLTFLNCANIEVCRFGVFASIVFFLCLQ